MIKFLFGKAGAGKNYIGMRASRDYGFHFYDADVDLPERFRKAIGQGEKVTEDVREEFIKIVIATIGRLSLDHRDICICQALPRDKYRKAILHAIPSVEFVWVDAPDDLLAARLSNRTGHIAAKDYAGMVNRVFEAPTVPHVRFENGLDPEMVSSRIRATFGRTPLRDTPSAHWKVGSGTALGTA